MKKDHIIDFRVYFEDTDLMGIVYHARYLYFFERARTELLRELGFTLTAMAQENVYFAIREAQVHYRSPAYLDDILSISTSFVQSSACTLQFTQTMHNQNKTLVSQAQVMTVCVAKSFKPIRVPNFLIGE